MAARERVEKKGTTWVVAEDMNNLVVGFLGSFLFFTFWPEAEGAQILEHTSMVKKNSKEK